MYANRKETRHDYEEAVRRTRAELAKEGFGVLTEIDVRETLKKKLNVEFDRYIILGACNPPFAYRALQAEPDIGILMPCNVIVYEKGGRTYIAATRPTITMSAVGNEQLAPVAAEVEAKLGRAVELAASGG